MKRHQNKMKSSRKRSWQQALKEVVTDPRELLALVQLDNRYLAAAEAASEKFPLKVPRGWIDRIEKGNARDPLLLQVLPLHEELIDTIGYEVDPLEESRFNPLPGALHKYQGRVLLTLAGACGVNCRFCFRRHFPYLQNNPGREGWEQVIDYIQEHPSVSEVIFSGGDPLVATDETFKKCILQLTKKTAVKRVRIHSRMPIVVPERITPSFIQAITSSTLKTIMVVHVNHPQEIEESVAFAMKKLQKANVVLLNQSVLLKGINDNVEVLAALSEALFSIGVLPYYLHMPDKVQNTAHFDINRETALKLHGELSGRLPGYLVPRLVFEKPGAGAKTLIEGESLFTDAFF